jgi:hypothetical protein
LLERAIDSPRERSLRRNIALNKRLVSLGTAAAFLFVVGSSANAVTIVAAAGAQTGSVPDEGGLGNFSAPSSGSFASGIFTENGISLSPTKLGQGGIIVSGTSPGNYADPGGYVVPLNGHSRWSFGDVQILASDGHLRSLLGVD